MKNSVIDIPRPPADLMACLRRFADVLEDDTADGHCESKEDMRALAELGAVRITSFGRSYLTDFGRFLLASTAAIGDVLAERQRHVSVEGWTPEHDDEHSEGEMAMAAACYVESAAGFHHPRTVPETWPWAQSWWKPTTPRRDLVKACALLLAEIDRLDRAKIRAKTVQPEALSGNA